MADHFYAGGIGVGISGIGASTSSTGVVTVATSKTAAVVELRVTDATTGMSKTELLRQLEVIAAYIEKDSEPA